MTLQTAVAVIPFFGTVRTGDNAYTGGEPSHHESELSPLTSCNSSGVSAIIVSQWTVSSAHHQLRLIHPPSTAPTEKPAGHFIAAAPIMGSFLRTAAGASLLRRNGVEQCSSHTCASTTGLLDLEQIELHMTRPSSRTDPFS